MGIFKRKVIKNIYDLDAVWGHLVSEHKMDVDTLAHEMKGVERDAIVNGRGPAKLVHIFKPAEAVAKGVTVTARETFDEHLNLIYPEAYLAKDNRASLERKKT
jgi:hypothetical protein